MNIPDPMIPNKPGAEDHEAMLNRTIYLDHLYQLDGRGKLDHPLRGTYTGLIQKYGFAKK